MDIQVDKPYHFAAVMILLVGAVAFSLVNTPEGANTDSIELMNETEAVEMKQEKYDRAKPLTNPTGYINTENVSIEENIGDKVILLDMWTYSCINCQRTFPYLKEWNRKYADDGLLIIGNHAPEFDFEKKRSNVVEATEEYNLAYPIVLDNNYGTWNAYNNRYWPQKYLIGVDGFIRYEHIGEGRYDQTEQKIRELLKELKRRKGEDPTLTDEETPNIAEQELDSTDVNTDNVETPEIYFGSHRNEYLANGEKESRGTQNLSLPETIEENKLYLTGEWDIQPEYARNTGNGEIIVKYTAKNVNMVLEGDNATVKVYHDGEPISESRGRSVTDSTVEVNEERLYNIVRNTDYGTHTLRLQVEQGRLDAYTFTFG
jgi:thiol-disulfide isomerase/thioredoxin